MSKDKWKNAMMEMHDWLRHKIKHSEEVVYGETVNLRKILSKIRFFGVNLE